ncbi:MAG: GDSL family lipase, partial [Edaphobacter sp.]
MPISWARISVVSGLFAGVMAMAQRDPPKKFDAATAAVRAPGTVVRIELIGDSTQTNAVGYGRGFCANLTAA